MTKKKILVIFTGPLDIGGIERSLIGMLDAVNYETCDVDLFLYGHHGALFKYINPCVNILPEVNELAYTWESMLTKIKHGAYHSAIRRLETKFLSLFMKVDNDKMNALLVDKFAPKLDEHYDLALSFFRPFDFITNKVNAKVKIGWVHTDYSNHKTDIKTLFEDYSRLDYIAAVSDDCARTFCELFPELSDKVIVVENILPINLIRKQAQEPINIFDTSAVNLLSIGRFGRAKNFDNVPAICRMLIESGLNVKWYLIGYGGAEALIRQRINEENMNDRVIILGEKENPYPYIAGCDMYVQPSRYEGKSVAVREAQALCKPVVITNYETANSQLDDGVDGIIVPMDNEGCARGIAEVIRDKELQRKLIENMRGRDYANAKEFERLCESM
ncbi:MAG: glycosyltransferase [Synergistaceae bacterium]|nr:glycosyltransferase [Synergistaceae bacterium]